MDIEKARRLKSGDSVHCPADRGDPAFWGKVVLRGKYNTYLTAERHENLDGTEYIWVEIQGPLHKSVWPSNRLG